MSSMLVETVSINYEDFNESFLTCGTCLCVYDGSEHTPKLLPCSHTVSSLRFYIIGVYYKNKRYFLLKSFEVSVLVFYKNFALFGRVMNPKFHTKEILSFPLMFYSMIISCTLIFKYSRFTSTYRVGYQLPYATHTIHMYTTGLRNFYVIIISFLGLMIFHLAKEYSII